METLVLRVAARHEAGRYTFPREFYLPPEVQDTDTPPENPEGSDLWVWKYERDGKPHAIAFVGKQRKPTWRYRFRDERARDRKIEETADRRRSYLKRKQDEMKSRREFQHGLSEGDMLVASWGYDQTNVDFYQVTDIRGKHVIVREIGKKTVRSEQTADYVAGIPNRFTGPAMRRKPSMAGPDKAMVKIDSSRRAYPWDGKPRYQTGWGYGH